MSIIYIARVMIISASIRDDDTKIDDGFKLSFPDPKSVIRRVS